MYSVRMRENIEEKNSKYGLISAMDTEKTTAVNLFQAIAPSCLQSSENVSFSDDFMGNKNRKPYFFVLI